MRIFFTCSELGLGHVSRVMLLGKMLEDKGHKIFFFSGGTAYDILKQEFDNVYPCTPIGWYENTNGIMVSASVLNMLIPLPWFDYESKTLKIKQSSSEETVRRYYDLRKHVRKINPEIILSDGDPLALRLGKRWKIQAIYVTNIIRPSYDFPAFLLPGQRFTERYVRESRLIVVPDVPEYTICEYNIGRLDQIGIENKTEFVGSFFDVRYQKGSEEFIFAPISGPLGTRGKMAQELIPLLSRSRYRSIVSLGEPHSDFRKEIGNCEVYGWLNKDQRVNCMKNAEIVIFSGGHGTCFEVIHYGKPSICVPTQTEQIANAKKLAELGCSIRAENKNQIQVAIQQIKDEKEDFKMNILKLNDYCSQFNGLEKTVELIENISI